MLAPHVPRALVARSQTASASKPSLPIVELRQYTLRTGKRDVLIELFEREFIESQESTGMTILGQFRDLDRPERFVWLRGFPDMATRARSLAEFYDGPVWKAHREVANGTMIDASNVLLLKPARSASGFHVDTASRAPRGTTFTPPTLVAVAIYPFAAPVDAAFIEFFERSARPVIERSGGRVLASFVTDSSPNNYPRLPIREGEHVFVSFASFSNEASYKTHLANEEWRAVAKELGHRSSGPPEVLRLSPTPRSVLGK